MNEKKKERKRERKKEWKREREEQRKKERRKERTIETLPSELRVLCTTCPTPKLLRLQPARLSLYSITQYEVYKAILSCNIS